MEISVSVTDTSQRGVDGIDSVFWNGKWQILINATLSGSAHGGRRVAELGGGGWLPVLFFSRPLSLFYLKWFHSLALHFCYCLLSISSLL